MWIVLLDNSGSMGDPFEQSDLSSRRARTTDAEIKFAAAKEVLMEELQELKQIYPEMALAIFAFTEKAELAYEGSVADLRGIELSLEKLKPYNGTDISAALNAAADYKEKLKTSEITQLVLITDGKSDRVKAMAAARRCLQCQLALSMLLIDTTEEGRAFAKDVVRGVGGTYQVVTSRKGLREAATHVGKVYTADVAKAEEFINASNLEELAIKEEMADRESVEFTAGYPGKIARNNDYLLQIYLHLENQLKDVLERMEQITDQFGTYPRKGDAQANQRIPIGTRLEVTPRINYINVIPPQQQVTWAGYIEEVSFHIHYAGLVQIPPPCSGFIDISASGLLLAQIPVSILVETGQTRIEQRTAKMISRVFASYSHKDETIVRACKAAYRGLGIQLFVDRDDIISGQIWRDILRRSIADHDLFQLFWSQAAADSDEVTNEWKMAVEIAPSRTSDFIRPVYWASPIPKAPEPLNELHFARLDLTALKVSESDQPELKKSSGRATRFEAGFPVIATVDSSPEWVQWLQEKMGDVVPFLEDLVGVRYFPPVTFLCDEHVVRAAREVVTTDDDINVDDAVEHVLEILQALALAFHTGRLVDPYVDWNERADFFDADAEDARADYDHVVYMAEYLFSGPTKVYLEGKDVFSQDRRSLRQVLEEISDGGYRSNAEKMVSLTLERLTPGERAAISEKISDKTLEHLGSYEDSLSKAAADSLLKSQLPEFADRCGVIELFHHATPHSLINCKTFPEYLSGFFHHLLGYIRVARSKLPDLLIDVGYSVPQSSFEWLQQTFPNMRFLVTRTDKSWRDNLQIQYFELSIADYERCVELLSEQLLSSLPKSRGRGVKKLLNIAVATHGVYVPAFASGAQAKFVRSLKDHDWPENAALPAQHKILLCMGAVERFEKKLIEMGWDQKAAADLARRFSLSVLVHEHFHAALATGLDRTGRCPLGVENHSQWEAAQALNESLAVWSERHFFRSDPEMLGIIDSYILGFRLCRHLCDYFSDPATVKTTSYLTEPCIFPQNL
ncbi:MAG: TIR domain-containing protein [Pseudomonadota bacterium]